MHQLVLFLSIFICHKKAICLRACSHITEHSIFWFFSLLLNTTACLMFQACRSPGQLPFEKGQDRHDCTLFEQSWILKTTGWRVTKHKTRWTCAPLPRLGTLPVPGSGVSGDVVSAPSSTSWIWDRKKQTFSLQNHHRLLLPTLLLISRAGREDATDVKGEPQKQNWLVYWCSFKYSTSRVSRNFSISIATFTTAVQGPSGSGSLLSQAGDIMKRISNTTLNR